MIHVVGEVVFHPFSDSLPEGGSWCFFDGPRATYTWVVQGDSLTLTPVGGKDACGVRGFIRRHVDAGSLDTPSSSVSGWRATQCRARIALLRPAAVRADRGPRARV